LSLIKEFREFAVKGNAIDLAVGVIIGAAFGKIVSSIVNDLFMPIIGLFVGGVNFTFLKLTLKEPVLDSTGKVIKEGVTLNYGNFLQTTFDFLLIALCIFLIVKLLNSVKRKQIEEPKPQPADIALLTEIRDLLKEKKSE
jgi:large conductance mechanosensitive channel